MLIRSALALQPFVQQILIACPAEYLQEAGRQVDALSVPTRLVAGGSKRRTSVEHALRHLDDRAERVLVHDAARPLVPAAVVNRVLAALAEGAEVVVPVVEVADSLRRLVGGRSEVIDRGEVRAVQTPQGFQREVLERAHAEAEPGLDATDDASLAERGGATITLVEGDPAAFKITTAYDFAIAEALVQRAPRV